MKSHGLYYDLSHHSPFVQMYLSSLMDIESEVQVMSATLKQKYKVTLCICCAYMIISLLNMQVCLQWNLHAFLTCLETNCFHNVLI
ncbi:hypothetical protein Hanom_Chr03g00246721 [Helianthus anomalus]